MKYKMFAEVSEEQGMEILKDFNEQILIENTIIFPHPISWYQFMKPIATLS